MRLKDVIRLTVVSALMGLLLIGCNQRMCARNAYANEQVAPEMQNFYSSLSPDAQQKFMQLDGDHRQAAMDMANQPSTPSSGMNPNRAVEVQYNLQMQQNGKGQVQIQVQPNTTTAPMNKGPGY